MSLKRVIPFLLLTFSLFGPPAASSRPLYEDAVGIINLSPSGYEQGLAVDYSSDGSHIAVGTTSGIAFFSTQTFAREKFIETNAWARSVEYSPDGLSIAAGLFDGTVRLWRVSDAAQMQVYKGHTGWVRSVEFSPDGQTLITAGDDDTVRIWNVGDGSQISVVNGLAGVRVVALSPDAQTMAVGLQDSSIQILSTLDGTVIKTLTGHEDWVRSLAFSPDGLKLASGAFDASARLWDLASGKLDYTLSGHQSSVLDLAFSPDGNTLATGSVDTTVKLWNVRDGGLLQTLIGHTDFVYGISFSPDGKILASSAGDNTARLWDLTKRMPDQGSQLPTSSDCRDCHHPHGRNQPPRVIQMGCEACHAAGIGMNWCVAFPRSPQAVSKASYFHDTQSVGVPIAAGNIAVQISYPANGETLYVDPKNLAPVFVSGRVFYAGNFEDITLRMEIWSEAQSTKVLFATPRHDGTFSFNLAINPDGDSIVAGAKAADPDCATCHEDFKSLAFLPDGQVHFQITAAAPEGNTALDERWLTVDTGGKTNVEIRVVDKKSGAFVPGLSVHAAAILYEWRDRYSSQVSDKDGLATLSLGILAQADTRYEVSVPPTILNGRLYESVEPVVLNIMAEDGSHEPVTIYVDALFGRIEGKLTGMSLAAPLDVWAIYLPTGSSYKTSAVNGEFVFENLPVGEYQVFVDQAVDRLGYHAAPVKVSLSRQAQVMTAINLDEINPSTLSGRVYDENQKPLPFGWITTTSAQKSALDPLQGTYYLFGLESAKLSLTADVPGYYSQAQALEITEGENSNLDFSLVLAPKPKFCPGAAAELFCLRRRMLRSQKAQEILLYKEVGFGEAVMVMRK